MSARQAVVGVVRQREPGIVSARGESAGLRPGGLRAGRRGGARQLREPIRKGAGQRSGCEFAHTDARSLPRDFYRPRAPAATTKATGKTHGAVQVLGLP